jgi:hypothetical protein
VNKVLLTGRLTRDPEMRSLSSGKAVTQFSIATNEYIGQGKEKAEYQSIVKVYRADYTGLECSDRNGIIESSPTRLLAEHSRARVSRDRRGARRDGVGARSVARIHDSSVCLDRTSEIAGGAGVLCQDRDVGAHARCDSQTVGPGR